MIKVMWGHRWDELLRKDTSGKLIQLMNETVDGDYQTFRSKDGAYIRQHFFGKYPETAALVADWTDEQIWALNRGGHDPKKIYAAFKKAQETKGKATVILAHTIKGFGVGDAAEGKNIAHQVKKMNMDGMACTSATVSMCRCLMPISKNCRTSPSRKVLKSIPICTHSVRNCTVICQAVSRTSPRSLSCPACKTSARCWKSRAKRSLPLSLSFVP
ncbi:hypothetical protein ACLB1T_17470 [Escherichia coli]